MNKIINGKRYDTDTAKEIGYHSSGDQHSSSGWAETLYQKSTGEFFIFGYGGAMSRYAVSCGQNEWSGSQKIIPLSVDAAKKWAEEYLDADEYEDIFGTVSDAEDISGTLYVRLPQSLIRHVKLAAADRGLTVSAMVSELLTSALGK